MDFKESKEKLKEILDNKDLKYSEFILELVSLYKECKLQESEEAQPKQTDGGCLDFDFDKVKEILKRDDFDDLIVDHTCEEKQEKTRDENIIDDINFAIKATGSRDDYSLGMCNGMRYVKYLIDGKEPQYESRRTDEEIKFGINLGDEVVGDYGAKGVVVGIHERIRGDKVKLARLKAGKQAEQVADEIGVSHEYYECLENSKEVQTVSNKQMWDILNALGGGDPSRITDNTSSHSEKDIYEGCIALMQELTGRFKEYLEYMNIDTNDREEAFCTTFYPTHIVKRLFLWHTKHSGGTSCRMKLYELGVSSEDIQFDVYDEPEEDADD